MRKRIPARPITRQAIGWAFLWLALSGIAPSALAHALNPPGTYALEGHFLRNKSNPDQGVFLVNEGTRSRIRFQLTQCSKIPAPFKDRVIALRVKIAKSCNFECEAQVVLYQSTIPANRDAKISIPSGD